MEPTIETRPTQAATTPGRDKAPAASSKGTRVPIRVGQNAALLTRIREIQDRITRRAFEIFRSNGEPDGMDLDHWLAAERELLWKPLLDLTEQDGNFIVRADVAGMEPAELELTVDQHRLVLSGETRHERRGTKGKVHYSEFATGSLYREIAFPHPVDPTRVKAVLRQGLLEVTAPSLQEPEAGEAESSPGAGQTIEVVHA